MGAHNITIWFTKKTDTVSSVEQTAYIWNLIYPKGTPHNQFRLYVLVKVLPGTIKFLQTQTTKNTKGDK